MICIIFPLLDGNTIWYIYYRNGVYIIGVFDFFYLLYERQLVGVSGFGRRQL